MFMSAPPQSVSTTSQSAIRELDHRTNDGIEVSSLCNPHTNHVFVAIADQRSGESIELTVRAADALDAFRHPFAYRTSDSVPTISTGTA